MKNKSAANPAEPPAPAVYTAVAYRFDWRALIAISSVFALTQGWIIYSLTRPMPKDVPEITKQTYISVGINGHEFYAVASDLKHSESCRKCQK